MAMTARERKRLTENLVDELNGAALYDALAAAERDERLSGTLRGRVSQRFQEASTSFQ